MPINTLVHRKQLGNVFIYTVKKIRRREKANKWKFERKSSTPELIVDGQPWGWAEVDLPLPLQRCFRNRRHHSKSPSGFLLFLDVSSVRSVGVRIGHFDQWWVWPRIMQQGSWGRLLILQLLRFHESTFMNHLLFKFYQLFELWENIAFYFLKKTEICGGKSQVGLPDFIKPVFFLSHKLYRPLCTVFVGRLK